MANNWLTSPINWDDEELNQEQEQEQEQELQKDKEQLVDIIMPNDKATMIYIVKPNNLPMFKQEERIKKEGYCFVRYNKSDSFLKASQINILISDFAKLISTPRQKKEFEMLI